MHFWEGTRVSLMNQVVKNLPTIQELLLSHFSCIQLCATPEMAAHQTSPALGFSRQEHGVGCHFLL